MIKVGDRLYRLGRKLHNFYLVEEGGKVTVVDAGGSNELPLLETGLVSIGLSLDDVEAVLITHGHTDHIGFARRLSDRGTPVKAHANEAAYVMDGSAGSQVGVKDLPLLKLQAWVFLAEMIRAGANREYRLSSVQTVEDGDVLDLPGRPTVIATPGHTAGHAGYLFEERRAICSGDALVTNGLIRAGSGPQFLDDRFHRDPASARASLDRLAALDADLLLPGHGEPWRGPIAEAVALARIE